MSAVAHTGSTRSSFATRFITACTLVATMSSVAFADRAYDPPAAPATRPAPVAPARRVVGGGVPAHFAQPPNATPSQVQEDEYMEPVFDRASPELGSILFRPRNPRSLAIAPLRDSLSKRAADLKKHGIDPANFTTREVIEDIADVSKALHYEKLVLFGVSYGSHYALRFMDAHPAMVEASILDAVAPPEATQLLDSAFVATAGRAIVQQIVADCRTDSFCATQYQDLTGAVASLLSATSIRKTVIAPGTGDWRTLEVSGPTILSVLGISSGSDDVLANVPRIITQFVASDTLRDDLSPRVVIAAAVDPALQTATWQAVPLTYWVTLCGDRPNGEPLATSRQLCDVLGVPYDGEKASAPVRSDIPSLLISSGYDAQTPAALADSTARRKFGLAM